MLTDGFPWVQSYNINIALAAVAFPWIPLAQLSALLDSLAGFKRLLRGRDWEGRQREWREMRGREGREGSGSDGTGLIICSPSFSDSRIRP